MSSANTGKNETRGARRSEIHRIERTAGLPKLLRKEVIQPQVPLRLPCYDFTPITSHTLGTCFPCGLAPATSGTAGFRGVTGGVYKARERIHRGVLIRDY